ncbi:hypothetical protein CORC01_10057 [Colletotrichum orchidophilum]|uniref:Uncharacterized protein n=1 Tax=Colletotrichum orchidophilum TaxID=1209926 RepID=A0A1G4AZW8_9PEZI|nr:uncharacterized protein CORC01_10057 [Colletotrichum orchidophilum]OHE94656.1 hypothetical protein CORC01_10057 [Colletotrichum orchidophilum]
MSDVFRKVGRGGSGNFFSKKDVEDAEKAKPEDIEAQKTADVVAASSTSPTTSGYVRAGRGGSGNYVDPSSLPGAKQQEELASKTQAAVSASIARSARGASGRGGAGNYTGSLPDAEATDEEVKRKEALEKKIIEDVEAGLPMPPKAYQHTTKKEEEGA